MICLVSAHKVCGSGEDINRRKRTNLGVPLGDSCASVLHICSSENEMHEEEDDTL